MSDHRCRTMNAIGRTPLIKLERLSQPGWAEIYIKYEEANPTGSMKDRMALSMIEGAEKRGELKPDGTVVEYTGGKKIVTIIVDSGLEYLDGDLFR